MAKSLMYLVEANVLLAILLGTYFLIRRYLSYRQRRVSLLLIPMLAFSVLILRLADWSSGIAIYHLPVYEADALALPAITEMEQGSIYFAYGRIYVSGVLIMLLVLLRRIIRVMRKLRRAKPERTGEFKIVRMPGENCFSFLDYIQLDPNMKAAEQEIILEHEKIHVQKKHSYDILWMQLVHALNWFNPVIIILKKELMHVHEYQVDEIMYSSHKTGYMEFLLAYSLGTNTSPWLLTNRFYSTKSLIKRMNMMRTKPKNRWAIALTLPFVACSFALVSWTFVEGNGHQPIPDFSVKQEKLNGDPEKMPEFVGGAEAMVNYLTTNLKYPEKAKTGKIEGTVYVGFVVTKTGSVTDVKLKRGINELLDEEALRVVKAMPDWVPGEKEGVPVNVGMVLPIAFKL